jgi:hypothetical protein
MRFRMGKNCLSHNSRRDGIGDDMVVGVGDRWVLWRAERWIPAFAGMTIFNRFLDCAGDGSVLVMSLADVRYFWVLGLMVWDMEVVALKTGRNTGTVVRFDMGVRNLISGLLAMSIALITLYV